MKKFYFLFIIIALFTTLTACDDGNNIDPGIEDELKGPFSITIEEDVQEWVSVDKTSAMENEKVTISVTIPQGKEVEVKVFMLFDKENQNYIGFGITKINDTTYTFFMPIGDVKVKATFSEPALKVFSAELEGTTLKWDANIRENYSFSVTISNPDRSNPSTYAVDKDKRELDLANLDVFSNFSGKYVEITVAIVDETSWKVSSYNFNAVITNQELPVLNEPTDLKIENNIVSWKWIDVDNECGGFIVTVNGFSSKIQYYPYYKLNVGFEDEDYTISVRAQGVSGKSNASKESTIEYQYKVPVYNVTYNLNDGTNQSQTIKTVSGKISDYTPERTGYIFNGWYTSNDNGSTLQRRFTNNELVQDDLNLYADWVEKENTGGIQKLPKPKVTVLGTIARWQAISGTNGYHVQISQGNEIIYDENVNQTQIDISNFYYEEGKNVSFKVRARGDGETTANSDYTSVSVKTSLIPEDFISNVIVDYNIGVVYWTLFEDVAYYVNGFNTSVYDKITGSFIGGYYSSNPEFVFYESLPAGEYQLEIFMNGINKNVVSSFTNIRLNSPELEIVQTDTGWNISWEAVRYADNYEVVVNGKKSTTENTYFDIPAGDDIEISVRASDSNADYIMSRAKKITIKKETDSIKITLPDRTVCWVIMDAEYTIDPLKFKNDKIIFLGTKLHIEGNFEDLKYNSIVSAFNLEELSIFHVSYDVSIASKFEDNLPKNLKRVTINSGATFINSLFRGLEALEVITLGSGFLQIEGGAFADNLLLRELNFSDDLLFINSAAFNYDSPLITKENGHYYLQANGNDYYVYLTSDLNRAVTELNQATKIIAGHAFYNSKNISENFILPETLVVIGNYAFAYTEISSIVLPETLKVIGRGAFYACSNLSEVRIPESITEIKERAFSNCSSLTDFYIHENIKSFAVYAIDIDINQVILDAGVYYLGTENNPYFIALQVKDEESSEIILNDNCVVLSDYLFLNMGNLTNIVFSDSIKYLGEYLFTNCYYLKEISLSKNVVLTELTLSLSSLDSIYYAGTKAEWNAMYNYNGWYDFNITVYCSDGNIELD